MGRLSAPQSGKVQLRERQRVNKLNVVGDAQADLVGHGGEHRAVFVYQISSYDYWERFWAASILLSANSEKTSLLSDFPIARSASAIATALAMRYLKSREETTDAF
jgi:hypothetical protein